MDTIRAIMPRIAEAEVSRKAGSGAGDGENLAMLQEFVKSMNARKMSTGWRGRRTGLVINDAHVTKDAGGYDNMESFWECALHDAEGSSTAGTPSMGASTPGSVGSAPLPSPDSGASSHWTRSDGGGGGDDDDDERLSAGRGAAAGDGGEGGEDEDDDGSSVARLAKRLEFPPARSTMPSPGRSRSEISTDEETEGGVIRKQNKKNSSTNANANSTSNSTENTKNRSTTAATASRSNSRGSTSGVGGGRNKSTETTASRAPAHGHGDALDAADAAAGQAGAESPALALLSSVNPIANNDRTVALASKTPGSKVAAAAAAASGRGRRGKSSGVGAAVSTPAETTRTTRASSSGGSGSGGGGGRGRAAGGGGGGGGSVSEMATRSSGRHSIGSLVSQEALPDEAFDNRSRSGGKGRISSDDDDDDNGFIGGWDDYGGDEAGESDSTDCDEETPSTSRPKSNSPSGKSKQKDPQERGVRSTSARNRASNSSSNRSSRSSGGGGGGGGRSSTSTSPQSRPPPPPATSSAVRTPAGSAKSSSPSSTLASPVSSPRRTRSSASSDRGEGRVARAREARSGMSGSAEGQARRKVAKRGSSSGASSSSRSPSLSLSPSPGGGAAAARGAKKGKGKGRGQAAAEEEDHGRESGEFDAGMMDDFDGREPRGVDDDGDKRGSAASSVSKGKRKRKGSNGSSSSEAQETEAEEEETKTRAKSEKKVTEKKRAAGAKMKTPQRRGIDEAATRPSSGGETRGKGGGSDGDGRGKKKAKKLSGPATPGPPRRKNVRQFVDISEVAKDVSHTPGLRRSQRHSVFPVKFWKGDNIRYQADEDGLLEAKGLVKGPSTTPGPASRKRARVRGSDKGGSSKRRAKTVEPLSLDQIDPPPGPSKYLQEEEECVVWDEEEAKSICRHVVMRAANLERHSLPATLDRPPGKDKLGTAAQAFNVRSEAGISGWVSGTLQLPPEAIKDSEYVPHSTQHYVVEDGQPNALEFAIALPNNEASSNVFDPQTAQRFLLSPGDHFFVPVNNVYRLENHSKTATSVINWVIIQRLVE